MSLDLRYLSPMTPMQRAELVAYGRSREFDRMVDQARRIRDAGLVRAPDSYVACSFGKDSAVLLHLALEAKPDVDVRFISWPKETPHLNNYDEVIGAWQSRFSINLRTLALVRSSLDDAVADRWDRLEQMAPADGYFVGMRMEGEGKGRKHTVLRHGEVYRTQRGIYRIMPLAWWTSKEIAAYTLKHDLPLLASYETEGWDSRTAARVPRARGGVRAHAMRRLRERNPAGLNALAATFPELVQYL